MKTRFIISPARSPADIQEARHLFEHYAAALPVDLGYQDFTSELAGLPGQYAPPQGELLLAHDMTTRDMTKGEAAGCVALRPLALQDCCEMKRLFILPHARGHGLGLSLAQSAVTAARELRYAEMRLDTLPTMKTALALYERIGFRPCDPYYAPTPAGTIFMALRL